jgi:hypothetical protein
MVRNSPAFGRTLSVPQAKGGQDGKGPVKKRSGEEKTQSTKEQEEEERRGRLAILARTDNWEGRFRQEILVAHKKFS